MEGWLGPSPTVGKRLLSELPVPWWVAGGWAVDLFTGGHTRPHKDLDIGILRRDALPVIAALPSWEFHEAKDGKLTRLRDGYMPRAEVNSLWCKPAGSTPWVLEFMLDNADGDRWIFRRDSQIQCPLAAAIRRHHDGIPVLAPEIQLLYKARATRRQDQADFDLIAPRLAAEARAWLRYALGKIDPGACVAIGTGERSATATSLW